jgi:hypothetical protein
MAAQPREEKAKNGRMGGGGREKEEEEAYLGPLAGAEAAREDVAQVVLDPHADAEPTAKE